MKMIRKTVITVGILLALLAPVGVQTANAALTLLPDAGERSDVECKDMISKFEVGGADALCHKETSLSGEILVCTGSKDELLGCAIKTGGVTLGMIPYFISYITNFFLAIIGLVCVLFIVIGGYFYIYGGLSENKEKGKKTIMHALMGLGVASLAWVIVNIIMAAVTS